MDNNIMVPILFVLNVDGLFSYGEISTYMVNDIFSTVI